MSGAGRDAARRQFGDKAAAYLDSASHARGEDLDHLIALADPPADAVALDLGCGVGHTLRRLAPLVRAVIGADVTLGMLEGARALIAREGISNAHVVEAAAGALPYRDASLDLVTCRLAAHHFTDGLSAFREARRVLAWGKRIVLADNHAPDDPELDRFVNTLERLRDPSHVREHTIAGWRDLLRRAGFEPVAEARTTLRIDRERWLAQARTRAEDAERVRVMLRTASPRAIEAFAIDDAGFTLHKVVMAAVAA